MELRRFFCEPEAFDGGVFTVRGEQAEHALRVLRHKVGYKAVVCLGDGFDNIVEITGISGDSFVAKLLSREKNNSETDVDIRLFAGLSKNDKFDFIARKAVELGVKRLTPVLTRYSENYDFNRARLERITLEAAKQCGRAVLTRIDEPVDFETATELAILCDSAVMAYENETENSVSAADFSGGSIALIIGAEGGFSAEEAALARARGIKTVSLGRRVLRTETAAVALVSVAAFSAGEMKV